MQFSVTLSIYGVCFALFSACTDNTSSPRPAAKNPTQQNQSAPASKPDATNSQPAAATPAHLLPIPSGQELLASCIRTMKFNEISLSSDKPLSDAGKEAVKVLAKLSQTGNIVYCSELWVDPKVRDSTKALMIEDRTAGCKADGYFSDAKFSLKEGCTPPKTGQQNLSKSTADSYQTYYRSSLSISGASAEQKASLSKGLNEVFKSDSGESRLTEDLR